MEALAARNKVLRKEIDEQTTKIDTLRKALQNAATSFGENDRRTQNWQIQLNNAEAALNDMNRELDENEKAIKEGGKAAEESGSKFEGFGKVLKTVGVALGAVAVAAGAAAVKLGKEVIAAYADYEQLVGGVDTLFKDSSQEIQRYAANAYKTAGLSANEYMETVTGFSASLIQSLGGDTKKAAKYADMAITDMSDNANKMGTDMSSIQNAYQGFAKQNYTMLDNLKLGYGGTKQEMERLRRDVARSGWPREKYLRALIEHSSIREMPSMDLISVLRNLQQINNNMNQVALIANAKGFVDTAAYWENVELLKETIHELLEVMYGSWQ